MNYVRVVSRNHLQGDYQASGSPRDLIAGDLRRLEKDTMDEGHLLGYAHAANCTVEQARKVLETFFAGAVKWYWEG
jgi:hypothetical protein